MRILFSVNVIMAFLTLCNVNAVYQNTNEENFEKFQLQWSAVDGNFVSRKNVFYY